MAIIQGVSRNMTDAEFCKMYSDSNNPILIEAVGRIDSLLDGNQSTKEEIDGAINTLEQIKQDL